MRSFGTRGQHFKLRKPLLFSSHSTLIVSFVVFVIEIIGNREQDLCLFPMIRKRYLLCNEHFQNLS